MPTTRKKVIKTVYKNSDEESDGGDFSDSGSEAEIDEDDGSSDDQEPSGASSENESEDKSKGRSIKKVATSKPVVKNLIKKLHSATTHEVSEENLPLFSVKDLTEADKLLPSVLNLSESDSSDDESPKASTSRNTSSVTNSFIEQSAYSDSETETKTEYRDVWSNNIQDNSEEIAKQTFLELEKHKMKVEQVKASAQKYVHTAGPMDIDVKDLLAQGEKDPSPSTVKKKTKKQRKIQESDSEVEDWEEVKESKIPQQGLQLTVDFPDACGRKSKKLDMEMMMRRKINRVKKEYQVYMHKVHVLCWLGHGNFVSKVLIDQEVMAAALALVPSKECYPGERIDMKYVEQITTWYKDKLTLKQDKNEDKFKPKALPLKQQLITQMKTRTVTTKKYLVFIFVSMLRAMGLQCRVMFNFVTVPLKPPHSELCSLSTKDREAIKENETKSTKSKTTSSPSKVPKRNSKSKLTVPQLDGNYDSCSDSDFETIMQVDGNDDGDTKAKCTRSKRNVTNKNVPAKEQEKNNDDYDVSPPKRSKVSPSKSPKITKPPQTSEDATKRKRVTRKNNIAVSRASNNVEKLKTDTKQNKKPPVKETDKVTKSSPSPRKTRIKVKDETVIEKPAKETKPRTTKALPKTKREPITPRIVVTDTSEGNVSSKYFQSAGEKPPNNSRKRSQTSTVPIQKVEKPPTGKTRTRSAPGTSVETSKYFKSTESKGTTKKPTRQSIKKEELLEDAQRVSHKDIAKKTQIKKNDVKADLIDIIKNTIKEESPRKRHNSDIDDDFKPSKVTPKSSAKKTTKGGKTDRSKIDRRVLSSDDDTPKNRIDCWCEVFVEELEQWVAVDVVRAKVHCAGELYRQATHPVCYAVGWDNSSYLKDLTRRYVPSWNTVTRKQRADAAWWAAAVRPWLGPKSARDKEEDENLDRMQLEAPLPKSIAEYKNHPLYALQRHLLKFEALYPPDAAPLGFVRGEAVYARGAVHTCRSRDTWLKDAKVVRLGEKPYKVVKARPKWDKLSNRTISDLPLEVFGPWQVTDYVPPTAVDGVVPRNAYGNVELFKECMLPGGTVHIKLPGLNKVAKKLGIDCAPAMTGFDFNGGYTHPVFDGFVVCAEFQEVLTEAWLKDQEEQEKRELEKTEARVYGNWRRLIRGLFIRERLKVKYGFEEPAKNTKNVKGPKFVAKKK